MILSSVLFILSLLVSTNQNFEVLAKVNSGKDETSGPVVQTNVGYIKGLKAEDGDYSMFMGIPYAEVDRNNVFGVSDLVFGFLNAPLNSEYNDNKEERRKSCEIQIFFGSMIFSLLRFICLRQIS